MKEREDTPAQEITIQAAEAHDLPRLFEISATAHATNYTELIPNARKKDFFKRYEQTPKNRERYVALVLKRVSNGKYSLLKATLPSGLIVGYVSGELLEGETFEIKALFVDPKHQGKGIGKKLMAEAIQTFGDKKMQLFVIEGNRGAITLYQKHGFNVTHSDTKKTFFGAQLLYMSREPAQ